MTSFPADPKIAEVEDNILTYYQGFTLSLGGKFTETDSLTWFTTGRNYFARFNGVLRTVIPPGKDLAGIVDPVLGYFQSNHLPFFWADYPPGGATGLEEYLRAKGVLSATYSLPAMGRGLSELPANPMPPEIEISEVRGPEEQAAWLDILMEGFQEPVPTRSDFQEYLRRSTADPHILCQHYLARWQGVPCSIATLLRAPRAAGLYHVTTLPAYRGRGLGTAVTLAAMEAAQKMGYERVILFASPDGYPLYQHLGFETVAPGDLYIWNGAASA